jgi:ABC-type bacteriocin/lantibiotic exporter with double-glycine peptidase domain
VITVTAEGSLSRQPVWALVNSRPEDAAQGARTAQAGEQRDIPLVIRADARATHQSVVTGDGRRRTARLRAPQHRDHQHAGEALSMAGRPEAGAPAVVYRRLLRYTVHYWRVLCVAGIALVLYAATDTGFAALMKPLLDEGLVKQDMGAVRKVLPLVVVISVVRGIAGFVSEYTMNLVARHVIATLRAQVFERFLVLPSSYYDRSSLGTLLSKLTYNIEQVADSTTKSLTVLIRDTFTIVGLIAWMVYIDAKLSLFILVFAPLMGLLIRTLGRRFRRYSGRIRTRWATSRA